jgi:hypothetical protein
MEQIKFYLDEHIHSAVVDDAGISGQRSEVRDQKPTLHSDLSPLTSDFLLVTSRPSTDKSALSNTIRRLRRFRRFEANMSPQAIGFGRWTASRNCLAASGLP